jgi:4-aminobutyrate aminotransferase/(S)-3-amino-2-methylpropionate transaminase
VLDGVPRDMLLTRYARIIAPPPGPRSRAIVAREQRFLAPGTQSLSLLAGIAQSHGEGAILVDADENRYIDLVAGVCVSSLGHGHPALARALTDQVQKVTCGSFATEARARLVERIAEITPPGLTRTQLFSGGSEAVEAALRLCRSYTKHFEVLGFWGGFHGKTGGVLGLLGSDFKHGLGPLMPGTSLVPYADCYRCPFGTELASCGLLCVEFMRDAIRKQTAGSLAAIIVEPIQGTAGNIIPPDGFLTAVRTIAHDHGALLVVDEMITGFGRTGKWFGSEHFGLTPDVMTIGKGLGAGFPVTGLISRDDVVGAEPFSKPSHSSSSYGGGPLAAAAALATVTAIAEERLVENAAEVGVKMLAMLRSMQERHRVIGDVRGRGLLIGVDLVQDRETRAPIDKATAQWIFLEGVRRGVLTMAYAPRWRINPPLTITWEQAEEALGLMDEVLTDLEQHGPVRAASH